MKKSKLKEDIIEKIRKRYEFRWERFKFIGFQQLLIMFTVLIFVLGVLFIFIEVFQEETSIPVEVLVLIVLGIQAVFMFLQTNFFQIQNKFIKIQSAPQLVPYAQLGMTSENIEIKVKNTRASEAHNVRYSVDVFDPKRKNLKKESIGTLVKGQEEYLLEMEKKDFWQKKIIINFYYDDVTAIPYRSKFMKKESKDTILFIGFA